MSTGNTGVHHRICPLCEATCGLEIRVEDGAVVSIRGDREDPFSRGHICPKGAALQDIQTDPDRLRTPERRIELAPAPFLEDLVRLRASLGPRTPVAGDDAVLLIGRRDLRSNNSWMHNIPRLMRGRERCTLLIHPEDGARRGIADGTSVALTGPGGRIVVRAELSTDILPGVVSLPHGWGHDGAGIRLSVARDHPGASFNDLLDGTAVDPLCGTAVLNGLPVTIEPVEQTEEK